MNKKSIAGEYIAKLIERFPKSPTATLAKKAYKEERKLFKSEEQARSLIRYQRGQHGNRCRKVTKHTEDDLKYNYNPFKLPESFEDNWEPFIIPKGNNRIAVFSDVHIPYHSIEALTAAIQWFKTKDPNCIVLNGDIMDCYMLSRYDKDPRKRKFKDELEATKQFLQVLKDTFNCPIYYKLGNHEERYEYIMRVKAPEFLDIDEFKLEHLLQVRQYNCQIITDKRIIKAGKLNIVHGHEFIGGAAAVNPARGAFLRAKVSTLAGHNHQTSEHSEPNLNREFTTCFSTGCLCELYPEYMRINKWNHGAAYVEFDKNGNFHVENKRIYKGQIL